LTNRLLGSNGGTETHTLTINEIPSHTHTGTTDSNGDHTHTSNATGEYGITKTGTVNTPGSVDNSATELDVVNNYDLVINSNGAHTHTFTTNSTGSSQAHNNMQPYISLNYIIKY